MKTLAAFMALALTAAGAHAASPDESLAAAQKQLEQAQERLSQSAREVASLSLRLYGPEGEALPALNGPGRPMLGVSIGGDERGGDGVRILSVSPGGPAALAGLRANDVILGFDGHPLTTQGKRGPHAQLLEELRAAHADTAVNLDYQRDGKRATVQVTPKHMPSFMPEPPNPPSAPIPPLPPLERLSEDRDFAVLFAPRTVRGFGSAEFLALTPGLGRYFGTDAGLLVIRAPKDGRLKLEEGDVVLDIDGRAPGSAAQAFRIFSSYRGGETLKLHVMRQQKRLELPVELPADGANRTAHEPGRFEDFAIAAPEHGGVDD